MNRHPVCSVIIKTHNSQRYLPHVIASLQKQTRSPDHIVIMDSASKDPSYLDCYKKHENIHVLIESQDIGFCKGNNIAYQTIKEKSDYVLFLNPDAFPKEDFLEKAIEFMENPDNQRVAALTGTLLGYDIIKNSPTNTYDSTGIFQKWYGHWYDRDQGLRYHPTKRAVPESIPAICGALFFCRNQALQQALIRRSEVFDNAFFMYKEDIDLSLRLRQAGWDLLFVPSLLAYHCRGWNQDRKQMPRSMRLYSARNEVKLHARHKPLHLVYSILKYFAVKNLNK